MDRCHFCNVLEQIVKDDAMEKSDAKVCRYYTAVLQIETRIDWKRIKGTTQHGIHYEQGHMAGFGLRFCPECGSQMSRKIEAWRKEAQEEASE